MVLVVYFSYDLFWFCVGFWFVFVGMVDVVLFGVLIWCILFLLIGVYVIFVVICEVFFCYGIIVMGLFVVEFDDVLCIVDVGDVVDLDGLVGEVRVIFCVCEIVVVVQFVIVFGGDNLFIYLVVLGVVVIGLIIFDVYFDFWDGIFNGMFVCCFVQDIFVVLFVLIVRIDLMRIVQIGIVDFVNLVVYV